MADIEKKLLSDQTEVGDKQSQIDQKILKFDEKSRNFVNQEKIFSNQKTTKEVVTRFENDAIKNLKDPFDILNDNTKDDNQFDTVANSPIRQFANSSIASRISSQNPDSSPDANIGRERSYQQIQSQISTLPFGLDTFFADA